MKSCFLFDDLKDFYYGSVVADDVEYVDIKVLRKVRNQPVNFMRLSLSVVTMAAAMVFLPLKGTTSPAHTVFQARARGSISVEADDFLRKRFVSARDYLGLKQSQVAKILGLSGSAVEKIEQGVYQNQTLRTKELLVAFVDWVDLLKEQHGDRKFIVRSLVRAKMNSLGNVSALEYAEQYPGEGLYDLIGLERRMNG